MTFFLIVSKVECTVTLANYRTLFWTFWHDCQKAKAKMLKLRGACPELDESSRNPHTQLFFRSSVFFLNPSGFLIKYFGVECWRLNIVWCVPCRRFYIKKMKVSPRPAEGRAVPGVVRVPKHSHHRGGRQLTRRSGREFALSYISLSSLVRIISCKLSFSYHTVHVEIQLELLKSILFLNYATPMLSVLYKKIKSFRCIWFRYYDM